MKCLVSWKNAVYGRLRSSAKTGRLLSWEQRQRTPYVHERFGCGHSTFDCFPNFAFGVCFLQGEFQNLVFDFGRDHERSVRVGHDQVPGIDSNAVALGCRLSPARAAGRSPGPQLKSQRQPGRGRAEQDQGVKGGTGSVEVSEAVWKPCVWMMLRIS